MALFEGTPAMAGAEAPRAPTGKPRVLLDLTTSLAWRGKHAVGIVRTERELAIRLLQDESLDVVPVVFHEGSLRALDPAVARQIITLPNAQALPQDSSTGRVQPARASAKVPAASLRRRSTQYTLSLMRPLVRRIAYAVLFVTPQAGREELRQSLIHGRQALRNILHATKAPSDRVYDNIAVIAEGQTPLDLSLTVHPSHSDVLFMSGLGWDGVDRVALARIKAISNLHITCMMYDLIPIKFPNLLGGDPKDYFLNYFLYMIDLCDHVFCNSQCTERDFLEFCADAGRTPPTTSVLHLGSNMPAEANPDEIKDIGLYERLKNCRFALSVGTFEIRKNYELLISIWQELVNDPQFDLDLVIVGMPGWGADDVVDRLQKSDLFGKRIYWFKRLSDAGLAWLYSHCHVFLYPSLYEGWGLPVVEAMQYGRPAIVSNRGAVPEAALGSAEIVDPDDREKWKRLIKASSRQERSDIRSNVSIPTWETAAQVVKEKLASISRGEVAP